MMVDVKVTQAHIDAGRGAFNSGSICENCVMAHALSEHFGKSISVGGEEYWATYESMIMGPFKSLGESAKDIVVMADASLHDDMVPCVVQVEA